MTRQPKHLSIKEAANLVDQSTHTIRRAIKKGTLTATLTDGKYQVLVSSLIALYTPTQEVPTQEVLTQEVLTQEMPSQEMPSQEMPSQEVLTQEAPTQEVLTQEMPTQEMPTQDLLTQGLDALLALIETLREELREKNGQLRAKDQQIERLMLMMMDQSKPVAPLPEPTEPTPPTEGKGFWALCFPHGFLPLLPLRASYALSRQQHDPRKHPTRCGFFRFVIVQFPSPQRLPKALRVGGQVVRC